MSLTHDILSGTILPLISIDEFDPKSGVTNEIIVIGLYGVDREPVEDLNKFVQRGSIDVIDAEVSPNPDEDGRYLLFVEFERNEEFQQKFYDFITDIENVTGKQDWMIKPYLSEEPVSLHDENLFNYIIVMPDEYQSKKEFIKTKTTESVIMDFFEDSFLNNLYFSEGYAIFNNKIAAKVSGFGDEEDIIEKYKLDESAIRLFDVPTEIHALWALLGEGYDVSFMSNNIVISQTRNNNILVLEDIVFIHT